ALGNHAGGFFLGTLDCTEENDSSSRNLCRENGWLNYDTLSGSSVATNSVDDVYAGVRQASQTLKDAGVPRQYRKQILESFQRENIAVRTAGDAEFGIRYFDDVNAFAEGRYLFESFPATRQSLALPPNWNQMTNFRQFQIRPGATIIEGPAASQGLYYPGGQVQKYILNPSTDLIAP
ncbi:MAG: hypothetical protein MK130_06295, partial [Puniceicoccaceae bacterium]|nr:hypothetical protein [Puniceicoccaceae bacterium]